MNILIIGSKGFIGSHALTYFRNKENNVYGCDVVVDYVDEKYFLVDATHPNFHEPFSSITFDICINCSGAASVPDSIKHPSRDFILNTSNVFLLLDAIKQHSPKCKFINLSSAAVYGNPEKIPIPEDQTPNPVSPYGQHKLMAENICSEFYKYFKIGTCNLRIFSAYGPGLQKQLFWDVYKKTLSKNDLEFFGTGNETRDFIYIDDLLNIIELTILHAPFKGDIINVANGEETTIKKAIHTFLDILNWKGSYNFIGKGRKGDPSNWCSDISIIKNYGYKQKVTLEQGLLNYKKWIQEKN